MKPKPVWGLIMLAIVPLAWAGPKRHTARSQTTVSSQSNGRERTGVAGQSAGAAIQSGTRISARLLTSLNAKKAKPGQRVVARVTQNVKQDGRVVIGKNARLLGHVVSAHASGKGNAGSQIRVVFDHLIQGHDTTALNTVVTSIFSTSAPPMSMPMGGSQAGPEPMSPAPGAPADGGGLLGGVGGAVGSTVGSTLGSTVDTTGNIAGQAGAMAGSSVGAASRMGAAATNAITVTNSIGATGATTAAGMASAGMSNHTASVSTNASGRAANQSQATSTFNRRAGNLQLKSGTEMQFQVAGNAQVRTPAPH